MEFDQWPDKKGVSPGELTPDFNCMGSESGTYTVICYCTVCVSAEEVLALLLALPS